jgi:hypothetical protein
MINAAAAHGLSQGAKVGVGVGVGVGVAFILGILAACFLLRRRKAKAKWNGS